MEKEKVNPENNLLTPDEVATELRVSKSTVLRAVAGTLPGAHKLAAIRIGRRVLIRREALLRYIESIEGIHSAA